MGKWEAAILSLMVVGLGQIYNGETRKGLAFMLAVLITSIGLALVDALAIAYVIGFCFNIYTANDAYEVAKSKEKISTPPPPLVGIIPPPAYNCSVCGTPLIFVSQYSRWYCPKCQKYV
jgi:TM2 domain-containing membrane protein YozV